MTRAKLTIFCGGLILACLLLPIVAGAQKKVPVLTSYLLQAADRGDLKAVKAALAAGAR